MTKDKKEAILHLLYVLEETANNLMDSADSETELKVIQNEAKRIMNRRLKIERTH